MKFGLCVFLARNLFSVKHFLLDCTDFNIILSRVLRVNGLKQRFDTVEPVKMFSFVKEIGISNKI